MSIGTETRPGRAAEAVCQGCSSVCSNPPQLELAEPLLPYLVLMVEGRALSTILSLGEKYCDEANVTSL